ncbi:MAG TPA: competence/damage-inducible protein A [Candidatus Polarisedimenticolaceae bacterium]|nr:competence/damage-inducible protein A [Candidatus Polarisedimenticolaceae bacterium]
MIQKVVILSTGDELTTGRVIDTNSAAIAERLYAIGIEIASVLKVGDNKDQILWALRQAQSLADIVIGTGGLGPTSDDLTTEVVSEFLGRKLRQDEEVARGLQQRFKERGISWSANSLKQAMFPEGSTIISNPVGTAPGFEVPIGPDKTLLWLSGVPQEMVAMLDQTVLPWIERQRGETAHAFSCTFKIHGVTEGKLDEMLRPIDLGNHARLSFRAHYPDLSLQLAVKTQSPDGTVLFETIRNEIRVILGTYIYAEGDKTLEEVIGGLLMDRQQTLALAESCTGGYISHRVTRVAGSSAYYYGGAVTYSNEAKISFLGVRPGTLKEHGAVSRETALEMSAGIKERTGADFGLSVTGVAGPAGGSAVKPVGTVWVSIAQTARHEAKVFRFTGDREHVIVGTSQVALNWLRANLLVTR